MREFDHMHGGRNIEGVVAHLMLDVKKANCYNEKDKAAIWAEIGSSAGHINLMIKEQMLTKFDECHQRPVAISAATPEEDI